MSFLTSVDIANRAIQHCGARRIAAFTDNSKQAAEVAFCYDKLRRAELRRSVWRFATRRATVRPLTATSCLMVPPAWAIGTTYGIGRIVQDSAGIYWISLLAGNAGNTPGVNTPGYFQFWDQYFGPVIGDVWATGNVYNAGEIVYVSGTATVFYTSLANNNTANAPGSGAPWSAPYTVVSAIPVPLAPYGAGANVIQGLSAAQNLYPLPYGYLRLAPQAPKVASTSTLGTSAGIPYVDWQFEGNYIVSAASTPLVLRYVADVSYVPLMDDLFCEGLAARIAYEVCETLTQSNVKLQAIAAAYQKFINDARLINWLEQGNTEPQEADYELTRGPQGVTDSVPAINGAGSGEQRQSGG